MDDKFQNLKVMVIDDSKTIRRTAETLLQREGCEVVTAVDGFDALSKIAQANPDIVFVDIMMPRLDGYQTCALIKNSQNYQNIQLRYFGRLRVADFHCCHRLASRRRGFPQRLHGGGVARVGAGHSLAARTHCRRQFCADRGGYWGHAAGPVDGQRYPRGRPTASDRPGDPCRHRVFRSEDLSADLPIRWFVRELNGAIFRRRGYLDGLDRLDLGRHYVRLGDGRLSAAIGCYPMVRNVGIDMAPAVFRRRCAKHAVDKRFAEPHGAVGVPAGVRGGNRMDFRTTRALGGVGVMVAGVAVHGVADAQLRHAETAALADFHELGNHRFPAVCGAVGGVVAPQIAHGATEHSCVSLGAAGVALFNARGGDHGNVYRRRPRRRPHHVVGLPRRPRADFHFVDLRLWVDPAGAFETSATRLTWCGDYTCDRRNAQTGVLGYVHAHGAATHRGVPYLRHYPAHHCDAAQ